LSRHLAWILLKPIFILKPITSLIVTSHQRKIIHVDADAFYASVEMQQNPALTKVPVAVGGKPDRRGVIATCNYIARQFGVRSAMPAAHALRLCPDLVFVTPNFPLYKQVSARMHDIFGRYTSLIEPLSLDEAYLDVSQCTDFQGSATRIANAIRGDVKRELGITVSAGVAPNKFLAKIASDWRKPNGTFVITPDEVEAFVLELDVSKINGVGKVTSQKLAHMGIQTCADILAYDAKRLTEKFGKQGHRLIQLANGVDERPVQTSRIRKSLSVEHTYSNDIANESEIQERTLSLLDELRERVERSKMSKLVAKRVVKVKFHDFTQTTLEKRLASHQEDWDDKQAYQAMISEAWKRSSKPVRLLGIGVAFNQGLASGMSTQLDLFTSAPKDGATNEAPTDSISSDTTAPKDKIDS